MRLVCWCKHGPACYFPVSTHNPPLAWSFPDRWLVAVRTEQKPAVDLEGWVRHVVAQPGFRKTKHRTVPHLTGGAPQPQSKRRSRWLRCSRVMAASGGGGQGSAGSDSCLERRSREEDVGEGLIRPAKKISVQSATLTPSPPSSGPARTSPA
ncbi:hypothetical protein L3Q82_024476, partial [Scortum barcoo]